MERITVDLQNGEQLPFDVQQKFSPQYLHAIRQHCIDRGTCVIGVRAWPTKDKSEDRNQWAIDQGLVVHVSEDVPPEPPPEPVKEKPKKKAAPPKVEPEPEPAVEAVEPEPVAEAAPPKEEKKPEPKPEPKKAATPVKAKVTTKPAPKPAAKTTTKKKAPAKKAPEPKVTDVAPAGDNENLI